MDFELSDVHFAEFKFDFVNWLLKNSRIMLTKDEVCDNI